MSDQAKMVEVAPNVYLKAAEVKKIDVTPKGKGFAARVIYGADGWESEEMDHDKACELACEISDRVNGKEAEKNPRKPVTK